MIDRFLRSFDFDRVSFWLGFIGGTLFWWLLGLLRPMFAQALRALRIRSQAARESRAAGLQGQLKNATILKAQQLHIAAPLFSLEDILIPPRLVSPPPVTVPGGPPPNLDIAEQTVPYMLDWPELRATFGAPTLSLVDALQGDTPLVILAPSGGGKTVALAHLATLLARGQDLPSSLKEKLPILTNAVEIVAALNDKPQTALEILASALSSDFTGVNPARLTPFLQAILSQGRGVLLLDGLDELPQGLRERTLEFMGKLLETFPQARCVTTGSPVNFSGLPQMGFTPLALAPWTHEQRLELLEHWGQAWEKAAQIPTQPADPLEPLLLNNWLVNDETPLTPLELTLKTWSVFAGDNLGPTGSQAIEAYFRRLCANQPSLRPALAEIALQLVQKRNLFFGADEAQAWMSTLNARLPQFEVQSAGEANLKPAAPAATFTQVAPSLLEAGFLANRGANHFSFKHPATLSYLVAGSNLEALPEQSSWSITNQAACYQAARFDFSSQVAQMLQSEQEPIYLPLMEVARLLRYSAENSPWCAPIIRQVMALIQNEAHPITLRARALSALLNSGRSGILTLCRQLLESKSTNVRLLGVLGCGHLRDAKAVPDLVRLMTDPTPMVRQAVCLALVAIGSQPALEHVADALLRGDEDLRRWSAEALANHTEEGHPTLQEGSTLDDILVRRAVIHGLKRVGKPWAVSLLEKMQVEDSQWVVKNAASQALEELAASASRLPHKLPALTELPWLIAFAGEHGIGIAPGKAAEDLLVRSLKEGSEEQKLAALETISQAADSSAVLKIYELLYGEQGDLREAAYSALWNLAGAGIILPAPAAFGLGLTLRQMS